MSFRKNRIFNFHSFILLAIISFNSMASEECKNLADNIYARCISGSSNDLLKYQTDEFKNENKEKIDANKEVTSSYCNDQKEIFLKTCNESYKEEDKEKYKTEDEVADSWEEEQLKWFKQK